jgi:hypothetical protein
MATARRLIFLEFLKASIADLITLFFHRCKTLKAVATATAAIVLLTPANFYHFRRPKLNFQPLSFTFDTFGKKLVARINVKKIKAKKLKKGFQIACSEAATIFYQNLSIAAKVGIFLAAVEALLKCFE